MSRLVGTVRELRRYPVKSMAAESLDSAAISFHGFAGDRRWAFIRPGAENSGFPWLTIREKPDLWHYRPSFVNPAEVESSKITVQSPDGTHLDLTSPELASRLGDGVRLIKQYSGIFDTFPLSLLTFQSVSSLSALVGQQLSPLRFRPNLLIDATESDPFPEDAWRGSILRIGSFRLRLDKRDQRCVMVNTDPENLSSNPAVLRAIAQQRSACLGLYGSTVEPGQVRIGDPVYLEP
jgi:uncharacterized protein